MVTLVTPDQRRTVQKLQRTLGLAEQTVAPDLNRLTGQRKPDPKPETVNADTTTTTIYVGNLPWKTTSDDLDRLFSRHGHVVSADVARRRGGQSKGYGLVEMTTGSAPKAIKAVHSRPLHGRKLVVRTAR